MWYVEISGGREFLWLINATVFFSRNARSKNKRAMHGLKIRFIVKVINQEVIQISILFLKCLRFGKLKRPLN